MSHVQLDALVHVDKPCPMSMSMKRTVEQSMQLALPAIDESVLAQDTPRSHGLVLSNVFGICSQRLLTNCFCN